MPDSEKPASLPVDHQLILDSSRLTQSQSEESIAQAKAAIKRSRYRLRRSAERMAGAPPEASSTAEQPPASEEE